MEHNTLYVEIRPTVRRQGKPRLVPLSEVANYSGFRTAFAFDKDTADWILEQGSTKDLRGVPVYADTLFVDFDASDGSSLIAHLDAQGIGYTKWHSGGRSIHLHVTLDPIFGAWVPATCKAWVKLHAPDADISFYHPGGMYRLPGTFHAKNPGKRKTLLEAKAGAPLVLTPVEHKVGNYQIDEAGGIEQLFIALTEKKGEGHRALHLWRLSTLAAEAGLTFDEALDHLHWWNSRFSYPPRDEETINRQCESAYRRLAKKVSDG